ncbi:MAG: hypothetical protein OXF73_13075 [Gammaproteobacteria bacterium]|nr:hypothetical protein [Gammaproteobacteria bacterium]MCY4228430.1 hypothetical protein [Gammaproteobacteria bacterium]
MNRIVELIKLETIRRFEENYSFQKDESMLAIHYFENKNHVVGYQEKKRGNFRLSY